MTTFDYSEYSTHKGQHSLFIENFSGLKRKFETEGVGVYIVILTNHLVVDWFINHIRKLDKALGGFLKAKI